MQVGSDIRLGAATHTGSVRRTNEDDYLLLEPRASRRDLPAGRLLVIADGMGGVAGGAEASRTAVRSLAAAFVALPPDDVPAGEYMTSAFQKACEDVFELSRKNPSLQGMGTTLTALELRGEHLVLGHVGDTRCLRLRGGKLLQLTEDHVTGPGEGDLTRCIGGGRRSERVDVIEESVRVGDVYLLATDGLWSRVPEPRMRRLLARADAQAAAEALVREAIQDGNPDNCTAVVLRVLRFEGPTAAQVQIRIPAGELTGPPAPVPGKGSLMPSPWPWVVLLGSLVIGVLALLKGLFGVEIWSGH